MKSYLGADCSGAEICTLKPADRSTSAYALTYAIFADTAQMRCNSLPVLVKWMAAKPVVSGAGLSTRSTRSTTCRWATKRSATSLGTLMAVRMTVGLIRPASISASIELCPTWRSTRLVTPPSARTSPVGVAQHLVHVRLARQDGVRVCASFHLSPSLRTPSTSTCPARSARIARTASADDRRRARGARSISRTRRRGAYRMLARTQGVADRGRGTPCVAAGGR